MTGQGGASGDLANLTVNFVLKGFTELKATLDELKKHIETFKDSVDKFTKSAMAGMKETADKTKEAGEQAHKLQGNFEKLADTVKIALAAGVGAIGGFVRSGLAAGAMGQLLSFQMERLSLTISGLFRPEILKISEAIGKLTNWIQSLSASQKQSIAYWIEGAAAALAVSLVFPKIVTGIKSVISAVYGLGAAIATGEALTGFGALLPLIGLAVEGMTALMVGTEGGRTAMSELWEALKEVGSAAKELWDALNLGPIFAAVWDGTVFTIQVFGKLIQKVAELIKELKDARPMWLGFVSDMVDGAVVLAHAFRASLSDVRAELGMKTPGGAGSRPADMHRAGGFESLGHTYERIALAAMRSSAGMQSPEERTANAVEEANRILQNIDNNTGNPPSPYAR
jgi:hypothetical protein